MYIIQVQSRQSSQWHNQFYDANYRIVDTEFTYIIKEHVTTGGYFQAIRLVHAGPAPDYIVRAVLRYEEFST